MNAFAALTLAFAALAGLPRAALAETQTLRLASLEWLPYAGKSLPNGGMSGAVAKALAARFGQSIRIDYFPWKRAMQVGGDPDYAGYFPAYHTAERARQCHFSAPMGQSTIGLAVLADAPLQWRALDDLVGSKLGVVLGYSNGEAFDRMVEGGKLTVDASVNDTTNLKKLLAGRIRAVVIDKAVWRYLLASDPDLRKDRARFVFDERPIAKLSLHVCFQRTAQGQALKQAFDDALARTDIAAIEHAYLDQLERSLGAERR